jgi:hypothetical protein
MAVDNTDQVYDADFVRDKIIDMQRKKAYGYVYAKFEAGVIQYVDHSLRLHPPGKRKKSRKNS